jgi:hypothetical protein
MSPPSAIIASLVLHSSLCKPEHLVTNILHYFQRITKLTDFAVLQYGHVVFEKITILSESISPLTTTLILSKSTSMSSGELGPKPIELNVKI